MHSFLSRLADVTLTTAAVDSPETAPHAVVGDAASDQAAAAASSTSGAAGAFRESRVWRCYAAVPAVACQRLCALPLLYPTLCALPLLFPPLEPHPVPPLVKWPGGAEDPDGPVLDISTVTPNPMDQVWGVFVLSIAKGLVHGGRHVWLFMGLFLFLFIFFSSAFLTVRAVVQRGQ